MLGSSRPHPLWHRWATDLRPPRSPCVCAAVRPVGSAVDALCAQAPVVNKSEISLPRLAVRTAPSGLHSGLGGKPGVPLPPTPRRRERVAAPVSSRAPADAGRVRGRRLWG